MRAGFSQLLPAALDYASVDDALSAPEGAPGRRPCYLPVKFGVRLLRNACTPSAKS